MATSIQICADHVEAFNDLDLLVVMHLLIESAATAHESHAVQVREQLVAACESYGPGCIDLQLEQLPSNEGLREAYRRGLSLVLDKIGPTDRKLPATTFATAWRAPGVKVADYDTRLIRSAVQRLAALVERSAGAGP